MPAVTPPRLSKPKADTTIPVSVGPKTEAKADASPAKTVKAAPAIKAPAKAVKVEKTEKATAKVEKTSKRPATENVVPKVPVVRSKHFSEEAIVLACLLVDIKASVPWLNPKAGRIELRSIPARLQVYINANTGLNCRKTYTQEAEVKKVLGLIKKVPSELLPAKWNRAIPRIEEILAANAAKA